MSAAPTRAGTYLLLRRGGALWGVAGDAVRTVESRGEELRVMIDSTTLAADEVLGVVADLTVAPLAALARDWWPRGVVGTAVHGGIPLAVVDARNPPVALTVSWELSMPSDAAPSADTAPPGWKEIG